MIWGSDTEWAGAKYIGDWVNGKRTGSGIYIYADGSRYESRYSHIINTHFRSLSFSIVVLSSSLEYIYRDSLKMANIMEKVLLFGDLVLNGLVISTLEIGLMA